MRKTFLPFSRPDLGEEEIAEVANALSSGWITMGPRTRNFEEAFAGFVGAEAALAVNSGTAALHVALLAHGVGPGQAVVVPTMTFASAVHVIEHAGAIPVLVDVDDRTLAIDLASVESAIAASPAPVRCIAPVHLHGQPCDLPALVELSEARDLVIVDDAAHALPAAIGEASVGGSRDPRTLTAFSFYATKNLTTGEGGMLTGPRDLVEEARRWVLHGISKDAWSRNDDAASWRYDVDRAGFKYNLSDVQAAIGLVQLARLRKFHERRCEIARSYDAAFSGCDELEIPIERDGTRHAWHIYALRLRLDRLAISRDAFIRELADRQIGASVHFIPVHMLGYYAKKYGFAPSDFPVASNEFERLLSLPVYPRMTDRDVDDVVKAVTDIVEAHRR